jgi:hypothetical protein
MQDEEISGFKLGPLEYALAAIVIFMLGMIAGAKLASAEEHPAFGAKHTSTLILEIEVADIPKLEAKAIEILRTKHGQTLEQARAAVRIEGKTDVARCIEFVTINAVQSVAQYTATNVAVGNQHPDLSSKQE